MKAASRTGLALVFAFALAEGARAGEPKPASAPFEVLKTQHMTVNVKINGKGPYRLVFDTGAPVSLLSNRVAKETGVLPKNFRPPFFAPFGSMGQFPIRTLELGEVKAENVSTLVMDHPTVNAMAQVFGPLEGIVGFSFFARYRTTIDYQAKIMTFVPTKFEPPDMMQNLMKVMMSDRSGKKVVVPGGLLGMRVDKEADDKEAGVNVKEVMPGSPAAKAGLKAGDRLLTIDSRWTDSVLDCHAAAASVSPGTPVILVVVRDRRETELKLTVRPGL